MKLKMVGLGKMGFNLALNMKQSRRGQIRGLDHRSGAGRR